MAAKKKNTEGMDFIVSGLKSDPKTAYADIRAAAQKKGLTIYPIMFGRAQAMLGIVKSAKRGQGKHAVARASKAGKRGRPADGSSKSGQVRQLLASGMSPAEIAKKVGCTVGLVYVVKSKSGQGARRGPGRPRKTVAGTNLNGLDGILAAVKDSQHERTRMQAALEKIQAVIADALS